MSQHALSRPTNIYCASQQIAGMSVVIIIFFNSHELLHETLFIIFKMVTVG